VLKTFVSPTLTEEPHRWSRSSTVNVGVAMSQDAHAVEPSSTMNEIFLWMQPEKTSLCWCDGFVPASLRVQSETPFVVIRLRSLLREQGSHT